MSRRRLASAALLALLVAAVPVAPGPTAAEPAADADAVIGQVRTQLRERDGAEPDAGAVVGALNGRVVALHGKGDYAAAGELAKVQMDYAELVLGAEHPQTLISVNNLALLYNSQGRADEAEPLYRRALAASEQVLGAEHPQTLTSVNNLAALYQCQGRSGEAEPLLRRALAARERVLGAEHPDTLTSVNNLADLYLTQGRSGEAEPLYRRALEARERVLGAEHPDTLGSVNNLGFLYESQGRSGEAEPLFRRALAARERVLGAEHPDTLGSVNNLAAVYDSQGRFGEAEPFYRRALAARERVLGAEHPDTLGSVNNLAGLYESQGRFGEAEPLYRRALAASEQVLGAEHPQTLKSVNNLASLYQSQGRSGEAEPLYRRALAASERVLGAEHPQTITGVNNLAVLYKSQGRFGEAEPLYRRALAASERVLGAAHPDTITFHLNLAVLLVNQDRIGAALRQLRTLDERMRGLVAQELASTEQESVRLARLAAESRLQYIVFTLALVHPRDPEARGLAADVLLRWKRLAADEESVVVRLARTSQDPRVVELAGSLRGARAELARLTGLSLEKMNEAQRESHRSALDRAGAEVGRLEVALAQLSRTFRGQQARRGVEWESVQSALPAGAALLELRAFRPVDFKTGKFGEPHWLALLLPAEPPADWAQGSGEAPPLRFWDLGAVADSAAALTALGSGDAAAAAGLYQTLFGPIDRELARYQTLFLAPDGVLDLVAFARLRVPAEEPVAAGAPGAPAGRWWIERQALRTVRVGRDLVAFERAATPAGGMLALGGVDYERFAEAAGPGAEVPRAAGAAGVSPGPGGAGAAREGGPGAAGAMGFAALYPSYGGGAVGAMNERLRAERGRFEALENTGPEVAEVLNYFWEPDNRTPRKEPLTGPAATETGLKTRLAPGNTAPRVLHLATHGFFLAAQEGTGTGTGTGAAPTGGRDRALTLAGLALAGANRGLEGGRDAGGEDGILYALEAQDLNLEGTDLVALSACNTGQGRVDVSEGAYGLVRAFQLAGSRHVLMTQWTLNDPLARDFMRAFYQRWLTPAGIADPAAALRATQREWLGGDDPVRANPRYWAPYVLIERG